MTRVGLTQLVTQRISQALSMQRRMRRSSPGICLHLLGKEQAERAAAQSEPEILHSDLSALLLIWLQCCHDPAVRCPLDPAARGQSAAARRLWRRCSALDGERLYRRFLAAKWAALATGAAGGDAGAAQTDDEVVTAAKLANPRRRADSGFWGPSFPASAAIGSSDRSS